MFCMCRRSFSASSVWSKHIPSFNNPSSLKIFYCDVLQRSVWTDFHVFIKPRNEDAVSVCDQPYGFAFTFNNECPGRAVMRRQSSWVVRFCVDVLVLSNEDYHMMKTLNIRLSERATRLSSECVGVWWDSWNFQLWPHRIFAAIFERFIPIQLVLLKCFHSTHSIHFWKLPLSHTKENHRWHLFISSVISHRHQQLKS